MKTMGLIFTFMSALFLSGCGFHLKEPPVLSAAVARIYVDTDAPNNAFIIALRRTLINNNIDVVSDKAQATSTLKISNLTSSNNLINNGGVATSGMYEVDAGVDFMVMDSSGKVLLPLRHLTRSQSFMSNATQILSTTSMLNQYTQSMQQGLADEIVNALAKIPKK